MSTIPEPRYALGNKIRKDDFCTIHFNSPPVFKVIQVESGGVHTPKGVTPAVVRIVCDMTIRTMPGAPFVTLVKVVGPDSEALIEAVAGAVATEPRG